MVTPGTTLDMHALDEQKQLPDVYCFMEDHFGCAIADITTGDCFLTEVDNHRNFLMRSINSFLQRLSVMKLFYEWC